MAGNLAKAEMMKPVASPQGQATSFPAGERRVWPGAVVLYLFRRHHYLCCRLPFAATSLLALAFLSPLPHHFLGRRHSLGPGGYATDDFDVIGISELAHLGPRFPAWDEDQLAAMPLTPGAHIFVSQLEEEDWPVIFPQYSQAIMALGFEPLDSKALMPYNGHYEEAWMTTLTVTAKGQITLKQDLLKHLGVAPGEKIEADKLPNGRLVVRAAVADGTIRDFVGCLSERGGRKLTIEEINKIASKGWAKSK